MNEGRALGEGAQQKAINSPRLRDVSQMGHKLTFGQRSCSSVLTGYQACFAEDMDSLLLAFSARLG